MLSWALEYHTLILFFLNGTRMKYKFILFSPWLLKSPVIDNYKSGGFLDIGRSFGRPWKDAASGEGPVF